VQADVELECDSAWEQGGYIRCEKCCVKFSNIEDDSILEGNSEDDPGRHLYCGKFSVTFKDKGELKGDLVESSELLVCRGYSQEFRIVEALDLYWKQVCFQPLFPSILGAHFAS